MKVTKYNKSEAIGKTFTLGAISDKEDHPLYKAVKAKFDSGISASWCFVSKYSATIRA